MEGGRLKRGARSGWRLGRGGRGGRGREKRRVEEEEREGRKKVIMGSPGTHVRRNYHGPHSCVDTFP